MRAGKRAVLERQRRFPDNNQRSIGAASWDCSEIAEVKTRNRYAMPLPYRPKTSERTLNLLKEARNLGFKVSVVTAWLEEEWNFTTEIEQFKEGMLSKDAAKVYDAGPEIRGG